MLVHDVLLIELWRDEIEPKLVQQTTPLSPLLFYSIVTLILNQLQ